MSWLALLIASAAVNLLVAELFEWFPWLAVRLIGRAVRRLPIGVRDRYRTEWLGELDALPGHGISCLIFAVRIWIGAPRLSRTISGRSDRTSVVLGSAIKHASDRVFALGMLIVFAPLLVVTALAVGLSSRGPVFFRQRRVGRDGKPFVFYKFRTMRVVNCPEEQKSTADGLMGDYASASEGRRTAVGRLLYSSSLDELPQLFNVLRGDMSIVGPRPESPEFAELVRQHRIRHDDRQRVKAGMTGWAQVHGLRRQSLLAEEVEWDNYYIDHWSLWLDLKIMILTVIVLFRDVAPPRQLDS